MKLFIFEWIIKHPAEGKGIKYVRNLNKEELIKACLFIEGKITKEVLMEEVIIPKQEYFRKSAQRRALKKKGYASSDEEDAEDADEGKEDASEADEGKEDAEDDDNEDDEDAEDASNTEEEDEE